MSHRWDIYVSYKVLYGMIDFVVVLDSMDNHCRSSRDRISSIAWNLQVTWADERQFFTLYWHRWQAGRGRAGRGRLRNQAFASSPPSSGRVEGGVGRSRNATWSPPLSASMLRASAGRRPHARAPRGSIATCRLHPGRGPMSSPAGVRGTHYSFRGS